MITQSHHMQRHDYDVDSRTALVQFINGAVYRVEGMTPSDYDNFSQASSPGSYWHSKIKDNPAYRITRVSPGITKSGKVSRRRYAR